MSCGPASNCAMNFKSPLHLSPPTKYSCCGNKCDKIVLYTTWKAELSLFGCELLLECLMTKYSALFITVHELCSETESGYMLNFFQHEQ